LNGFSSMDEIASGKEISHHEGIASGEAHWK
jgi:hypothetical protein